jgi:hypothetical protein
MERYAPNLQKRYFFTKIMLPYHRKEDSASKSEILEIFLEAGTKPFFDSTPPSGA